MPTLGHGAGDYREKVMVKSMEIEADLIVAHRLATNDGYTWTLASRLGGMLRDAEDKFGERDRSYTILGIEFCGDFPQVWYPDNCRHVVIQLTESCLTNLQEACYQLAHECIHLLSPSGSNDSTNVEEGVACYFAAYYMRTEFAQQFWPTLPSYRRAFALVTPRLDADVHCMRRLRKEHSSFSQIPKEAIAAEFPALSSSDIDFLACKFDRNAA